MKTIFGKIVYTGETELENTAVVMDGKTIAEVAQQTPDDGRSIYEVITPAFIDSHCHIGLQRAGEPTAEGETNDKMESIMANADALDSIQMDDVSFRESVEAGVLYSCVVPGSGNILSGRSAVVRNYGLTTNDALLARAGIKGAFGYNPISQSDWKGTRPRTRMGELALLRKKLFDVRQKMQKEESVLDAEEEVLRDLLEGKEVLRAHVHKIDDISAVLRLVDEFALAITIEHACDVHDPHIFEELARRDIPVNYGPLDSFAYKVELKHENWQNLKHLLDSGVRFGLMSDHPVILQKMLFFGLRWFIRCGMKKAEALGIVTRRNAEILGIQEFLGTLTKGKWASCVCWNGDPFDLASYPVAVYGEGELLYSEDGESTT
jgi:imidazolonepropionase-like amidohydrolase